MRKRLMPKILLSIEILFVAVMFGTIENVVLTAFRDNNLPVTIQNSSVEIIEAKNMPVHWAYNSWGNHTATFACLNEGYCGYRSVKVEVADYNDGDAKWFFDPVRLDPGDYVFSNHYRSDVDTQVIAAVSTSTGAMIYVDMPVASASTDWMNYEAVFAMPENGETITVYHLLSRNGYLITDDYSIKPYRYKGFNRGLVTITFDDGWEENPETVLPIMRAFGYKSNHFYASCFIENPRISYAKEHIQLIIEDGHEIGSHSVTHPHLTVLSEHLVTAELVESKAFLESYLTISIEYFASPYGAYNAFVNEKIMNHYSAHRTVDAGYNSKDNFDVSRLKCQNILSSTTSEQVAQWVKKAKQEKLWLILLYHRVATNPNEYDTTPELFYEHMQVIKDAKIPVVTISDALAELQSQ